jgi:hypothetical protein
MPKPNAVADVVVVAAETNLVALSLVAVGLVLAAVVEEIEDHALVVVIVAVAVAAEEIAAHVAAVLKLADDHPSADAVSLAAAAVLT